MVQKPKQRVSKKEKGPEWIKQSMEYVRGTAKRIVDDSKAKPLYDLAGGLLDESQYLYVTNPRSTTRPELMGFPSKLRNIPIVPQIFAVLMGEKTKRFIDFQVINLNSDLESKKLQEETSMVLKSLQNDFYNQVSGTNSNEVQEPEQIRKKINAITDDIAKMGQEGLNYMRWYNELDRKFKEQFYHALCVNVFCSYKTIDMDEPTFDVVHPCELSIIAGRGIEFIEDAEGIVRKMRMSLNEIYDAFHDFDDFDKLKELFDNNVSGESNAGSSIKESRFSEIDIRYSNYNSLGTAGMLFDNLYGNKNRYEDGEYYDVEHVVWDSYVKRYVFWAMGEDGQLERQEVSEDYKPAVDEDIEEIWVKQPWHGYFVADRYVIGGAPLTHYRASVNNPYKSRKPYNGRILNGISVAAIEMPFQIKHNIINYYIEKLLGKNMAFVAIPLSILPDGKNEMGVDTDTSLYYADAHGVLLVDDADAKSRDALQYIKVLDLNLNNALQSMLSYLNQNKGEAEEVVGINRFRKGQNNSSDGKFVSQQAEYRGSMMSEHLFTQVDECHQRDLQGCLDLSQVAWASGKKSAYINSDFKRAYLEINPEVYPLADMGVGINNNARETEKLNLMKEYAKILLQDPNIPKKVVPKIIKADNMAQLIEEMENIDAEYEARQQNMSDQERQHAMELMTRELDKLHEELDFKYYKTDADNVRAENVATINSDTAILTAKSVNSESAIPMVEDDLKKQELAVYNRLENLKIMISKYNTDSKERTDKYKADKTLQVARENTKKKG